MIEIFSFCRFRSAVIIHGPSLDGICHWPTCETALPPAHVSQFEWLSELGVMTLNDKMVLIGDHIQLVGRSDSSRKDVPDLFESEQVDPEKPIITIQHRPTEFKQLSENGCDLVMAGHTHGISFPFCFLIAPVNDMLSGSRVYDSMLAVTSAGASAWGIHYKWPDCSDIIHVHITFTEAEQ